MIIKILKEIIENAFKSSGYEIDSARVILSNRPDLCDYQCDDVFKLTKRYHKSPLEIGTDVVNNINEIFDFDDYFESVKFEHPGFINIKLSSKFINKNLRLVNEDIKALIDMDKKETYVLDFGGANVAKPLHVGHMSPPLFGESISRILKFYGHSVITDVHLGDYGLNIGQVIYGVLKDNKKEVDIDIKYLDYIYPLVSKLCKEDEEVNKKCAEITFDLQNGDPIYQRLFKKIVEVSVPEIKKIYDYLGANFDLWLGEASAYTYLDDIEELLKSKGMLKESEGALVVDVSLETDKKEIPPLIFKKSNGAYLYASTDLSTLIQRKQDYNPDYVLYFTDNRQALHFEQVFRVSDKAGIIPFSRLEHLPNGTANGIDGKPYKTRTGNTPKLQELFDNTKEIFISKKDTNSNMSNEDLDIIVNAILKFAVLQNSRDHDYIFDLNKFSEVSGKTGPYILYTYLRIKKILDNEESKLNLTDAIYNDVDRNLRIKILEYGVALNSALKDRMPHYIAEYVYNLCVCANVFYGKNHIATLEDEINKSDWLYLLRLTNSIIKEMLYLLIIEIPSIM